MAQNVSLIFFYHTLVFSFYFQEFEIEIVHARSNRQLCTVKGVS